MRQTRILHFIILFNTVLSRVKKKYIYYFWIKDELKYFKKSIKKNIGKKEKEEI